MSPRKKILVVEDHLPLRTALEITLPDHGFAVVSAGDGQSAVQLALAEQPDLVLLDIMLPGRSGFEVCQELRRRNSGVPIIVLTAKTADEDELLSFQLGADDFVRKPFKMEALVARIKALLLRVTLKDSPPRIVFGSFVLDVAARTLCADSRRVDLTPASTPCWNSWRCIRARPSPGRNCSTASGAPITRAPNAPWIAS